jgi:hypothetical protein
LATVVLVLVLVLVLEEDEANYTSTLTTYQILSSVCSNYPTRSQKLEAQQAMSFAMT